VSLLHIAWKNLRGNAFRSLAIFLCAALVAGLALTATIVVRGAEASLRSGLQKLGADLLVLPWGTVTEKIRGIRLMSAAIDGWMPAGYMEKIAALEGVAKVSPQLFLATLEDSPYSPYPDMHLVAFDPETDFTLGAWLDDRSAAGLREGEAIAGAQVALSGLGSELTMYGVSLRLVDRLAPTETSIDHTLFVNFETAKQMIAWSESQDSRALNVMPEGISAVMVRLELGAEPREMAVRILEKVNGVVPLETPNLFQAERRQMIGVLRAILGVLGGIWGLALVFMGLVFSIAVNERRYEMGVLRALGFNSPWILKALLTESVILAATGGLTGVLLAALGFAVLGNQVESLSRLPLPPLSTIELIFFSMVGLALALASVTLAAFLPAWRISRVEVALTMRE
jgi:putative ABC transport system permease protein